MHHELISRQVFCPYCGEQFEALIDSSEGDTHYTEDCYVCCKPIIFVCSIDHSGDVNVTTLSEDDAAF
ncbi:CPXCG motif-containing cysteine-rich protein [Oceanicoccus sagamiensis]|uniref:CPXCG motif-containing cysteine-rich protein n=1 Tax=Oceanicoccus sagamiensis TaxID=716816 RepID=A0A1X9NDR0_9GAMM|nr:CPXCG motif-containing cysteine-rich protein [Oceanicoccus sagamiensis]ARN74542.1 hypothetical protein BST96_10665 [Oceanicoccus sagamiensis]